MSVEWGDPPEVRTTALQFRAQLAELKKHPGAWALVRRDATPNSGQSFKKAGCVVTRRGSGNGRYNVYAMWPGEMDAS